MEESVFKTALAAISSGDYCESDVKVIKEQLNCYNKEELALKRKIEKETNDFVKNKDKHHSDLKTIRSNIKTLKHILKDL
jgi:hypothetical protein